MKRKFTNSERVLNYIKNLMTRGDTLDEAVITSLKYFFPEIDEIPRYRR